MDLIVVRKSEQRQVNVSHEQVLALCDLAGMPRPDKDNPLRLGSPARGERDHFILECITKDGEAFSLVMGDTHAIWDTPKHQGEGVGAEKLRVLVDALPKGGKARLRVTAVRWIRAGDSADHSGAAEAIEV